MQSRKAVLFCFFIFKKRRFPHMERVINDIEKKYLSTTYYFIENIFKGLHLPSHDHSHHLRVWQYAKEFIIENEKHNRIVSPGSILNIFFSCFFHDAGMSITFEKIHGKESRKIFEKFALENLRIEPSCYSEICHAIENHDNKEALASGVHGFPENSGALSVLSICDDLDAFGIIGIIRYSEIYLVRKIPTEEIPEKATENLSHRIRFFQKSTNHLADFSKRHESRAQITLDFFNKARDTKTSEFHFIKIVKEKILEDKLDYLQFSNLAEIKNSFSTLRKVLLEEMKCNINLQKKII